MTGPASLIDKCLFTSRVLRGMLFCLTTLVLLGDLHDELVLAQKRDEEEGEKGGWLARTLKMADREIRRRMCGMRGVTCLAVVATVAVGSL